MPEPKTVKNRVHLDLLVGPEAQDAEVERLVALGASVVGVHDGDDGRWTLLTDPEGNEFDVSCVDRLGASGANLDASENVMASRLNGV